MRAFAALSLLLLVAFPAFAADYSNDSDSININYTGVPPVTAPGGGSSGGDTGGTAGGSGSSGGADNSGSTNVTVPVTVVTGGTSGSGGVLGGGSNGSQGQTGGGANTGTFGSSGTGTGSGNSNLTGQDILTSLQGNQAVVFGGGSDSLFGGSGSSGSGAESFGTVTLSGKKVRDALASRDVSEILLGTALGRKYLTKGDATIAAASAILNNPALQEVVLSLQTINFTYTAEGRLFAVFPIEYPLKVSINPAGTTIDERVGVEFPWYSFFLQTYTTKKNLQAVVDAAVTAVVSDTTEGVDRQGKLLTAVTDALNSKLIR